MLTIRLRRTGARKDPHYRVVVADRASGRDGPFLEILGHYHPRQRPAEIFFNMERTETWLGQGARMSDTVASLYRRVRSGRVEEVPEAPAATTPPAPSDSDLEAAAEAEAEATAGEDVEAAAEEAADADVEEAAEQAADADVEAVTEAAEATTDEPSDDTEASDDADADEESSEG